jgi:hypothetical protein
MAAAVSAWTKANEHSSDRARADRGTPRNITRARRRHLEPRAPYPVLPAPFPAVDAMPRRRVWPQRSCSLLTCRLLRLWRAIAPVVHRVPGWLNLDGSIDYSIVISRNRPRRFLRPVSSPLLYQHGARRPPPLGDTGGFPSISLRPYHDACRVRLGHPSQSFDLPGSRFPNFTTDTSGQASKKM